ncbi:MAG: hypothetical protein N3C60_05860 [Calditerrivibrio sp.]|nr:hypothetical protein [Calditerrivibrio sp.]
MKLNIISYEAIERGNIDLKSLYDVVEKTILLKSTGAIELPPKPAIYPRKNSFINVMPAYIKNEDIAGMKLVSYYPENSQYNIPTINALIILCNPENGLPEYIIDGNWITAYRTAAVSAVTLKKITDKKNLVLSIIGSGVQAKSHIDVFSTIFSIKKIYLHSRNQKTAKNLKKFTTDRYNLEIIITDINTALSEADVVISATTISKDLRPFLDPTLTKNDTIILPVDYASPWYETLFSLNKNIVTDDKNQFLKYHETGYFKGFNDQNTLFDISENHPKDARLAINLGIGAFDLVIAHLIKNKIKTDRIIDL